MLERFSAQRSSLNSIEVTSILLWCCTYNEWKTIFVFLWIPREEKSHFWYLFITVTIFVQRGLKIRLVIFNFGSCQKYIATCTGKQKNSNKRGNKTWKRTLPHFDRRNQSLAFHYTFCNHKWRSSLISFLLYLVGVTKF